MIELVSLCSEEEPDAKSDMPTTDKPLITKNIPNHSTQRNLRSKNAMDRRATNTITDPE